MNIEKIQEHYDHAREKHPYFCDGLTGKDIYGRESCLYLHDYYSAESKWRKEEVENRSKNGTLKAEHVLGSEYYEILEAYARGDIPHAIEECYDAIAVLLRVIDVLAGQQALGKPKESKNK